MNDLPFLLFVDDDVTQRKAFELQLSMLPFREGKVPYMLAASGEDALEQYQAHHSRIALVFLDYVMGEMNGEETFHKLKAINPQLRAYMISGYDSAPAKKLMEVGLLGYDRKPFGPDKLFNVLKEHYWPNVSKYRLSKDIGSDGAGDPAKKNKPSDSSVL